MTSGGRGWPLDTRRDKEMDIALESPEENPVLPIL